MPAPMAEAVWTQATQRLVLGVKLVKGAEAQVLLGGDETHEHMCAVNPHDMGHERRSSSPHLTSTSPLTGCF